MIVMLANHKYRNMLQDYMQLRCTDTDNAITALTHSKNVPCANHSVLFGDIGFKAAGSFGRNIVYIIIYSLDATRCVILHLAASQSLRHIFPVESRPPVWQCGAIVLIGASLLVQVCIH